MSIKIDLLQKKKNYAQINTIFKIGRYFVIVFGVITVSGLIIIFTLFSILKVAYQNKINEKQRLEAELNALQEREVEVLMLNQKTKLFNDVLDTSPNYGEIFSLLDKKLNQSQSSSSAYISDLSINSKKGINVSISFIDNSAMTKFLKDMESDEFKKDFRIIKVGKVSVKPDSVEKSAGNSKIISLILHLEL